MKDEKPVPTNNLYIDQRGRVVELIMKEDTFYPCGNCIYGDGQCMNNTRPLASDGDVVDCDVDGYFKLLG